MNFRPHPDDIWIAILTQLSTYVKAHTEKLHGKSVSLAEQKKPEIVHDHGTHKTISCAMFAQQKT